MGAEVLWPADMRGIGRNQKERAFQVGSEEMARNKGLRRVESMIFGLVSCPSIISSINPLL